ncbi:HTH-type transcriptional regulator cbl [Dickeya solani]|nr:HTH-type transcriptional regulator cbl [Dickeya solani]
MQRLEQLIGKELFARHGRNKLLTEHGIQFLGYARKILQFNDEACASLMYSDIQGTLTIGASDDTADTILPFILQRVTTVFPKLSIAVSIKRSAEMADMLQQGKLIWSLLRPAVTICRMCCCVPRRRCGIARPIISISLGKRFRWWCWMSRARSVRWLWIN